MIEEALNNLIRGNLQELKSFLKEVSIQVSIQDTKTVAHYYHIELDGNGRPKTDDFIDFICSKVVDYITPPRLLEEAKKYFQEYNSTHKILDLAAKAKTLFTKLPKTGEGGEILLYILTQEYLKIPQLLCKMPFKTNSNMHIHGVDAVHAAFNANSKMLEVYWGESKMYQDISDAVSKCFTDLKEYLIHEHSNTSPQTRDIQLVKDNLDLNNEELETAIVEYLDKNNPKFNKVNFKGICFVGFDSKNYPLDPNQIVDNFTETFISEVDAWNGIVQKQIQNNSTLETFDIHIFLIPFQSVEDFRRKFLEKIKSA